MPAFFDANGMEWPVKITLGTVEAFYESTGEDLLMVEDGDTPLVVRLASGGMLMSKLLWCICGELAATRSISRKDFQASITGPQFAKAQGAVFDSLENFIHTLGQEGRAKIMNKARTLILGKLSELPSDSST